MNKLLLLLLLFGVNANGADKPILSVNGLEGFTKYDFAPDGMRVLAEDYSHIDKTYDAKAIENQVELRLRQAGIKIDKGARNYLWINAQQTARVYTFSFLANRNVTFEANGKTYRNLGATVWKIGGQGTNLRNGINFYTDRFLLAYLKANPKKD